MRILVLFITGLLAACGGEEGPPLLATDIEVSVPMPGTSISSAYMTLTNNSDEPIRITKVSSPQYALIEIHETTIDDNVARMRQVDELAVKPGESLRLQRGGIHLMMMQPATEIETVTLLLYDGDLLLMSMRTTPAAQEN